MMPSFAPRTAALDPLDEVALCMKPPHGFCRLLVIKPLVAREHGSQKIFMMRKARERHAGKMEEYEREHEQKVVPLVNVPRRESTGVKQAASA